MNFFKKLFGTKGNPVSNEQPTDIEPKQSHISNADKLKQLEELVKPLLRDCTRLILEKPSSIAEGSNMISHFGGNPYFEEGERWPVSKAGNNLSFIFQVFNIDEVHLPKNIKLVQFYYDHEESAYDTDCDGWLVKIYEELHTDKVLEIKSPEEVAKTKFCNIRYENAKSLPDWEGLFNRLEIATDFAEEIDDNDPWEVYDSIVKKLTGQEDYQSQLGGYPDWVQNDIEFEDENGTLSNLLFQIDSEDLAGLMWGDAGLAYVFYNSETKRIDFELQSH